MSQALCETCRYFRPPETHHEENLGQCRRHPPQGVGGNQPACWPLVEQVRWCGEHAPVPVQESFA